MRQHRSNKTLMQTLGLCCVLLMSALAAALEPDERRNIVIITSSNSSFQQQAAARIRANLDSDDANVMIRSADEIASLSPDSKTIHVAIGEYAINALQAFDENAVVLRINNRLLPDTRYSSVQSDLLTEQPACKHLQLIGALNPEWTTIGVLSSINSIDTTAELTICAIKYNLNLQLYAITDESDLLKTLETAVETNQVLLAIVDPLIYNSRTVKNILLTSYRHRKPVIGYSDSFVQAGAVAAVFTSPESVGDDAARIIADFVDNHWQFRSKTYYPSSLSVSTNSQVAAALEIELPDEATILKRIQQAGTRP